MAPFPWESISWEPPTICFTRPGPSWWRQLALPSQLATLEELGGFFSCGFGHSFNALWWPFNWATANSRVTTAQREVWSGKGIACLSVKQWPPYQAPRWIPSASMTIFLSSTMVQGKVPKLGSCMGSMKTMSTHHLFDWAWMTLLAGRSSKRCSSLVSWRSGTPWWPSSSRRRMNSITLLSLPSS